MLEGVISGPKAWHAKDLAGSGVPKIHLDAGCTSELAEAVQCLAGTPTSLTVIRAEQFALLNCSRFMDGVRNILDNESGFVVIGGLLPTGYSEEEARLAYWLFGNVLGSPFKQNVKGAYLYDVRDMGQKVEQGVRPSITTEETTFHTDYSFGEPHPDYVGLLCLQPAAEGGCSQLVSAYSVHNEILGEHPDALRVLYQDFQFDKRGEFLDGEAPTAERPVFSYDGRTLTLRYMREYIRCGHEKAGTPLTAQQARALNLLDDALKISALRIEFLLAEGEMLWVNNRDIAHNRTPFKDDSNARKRRHYIRLWLTRRLGDSPTPQPESTN